MSFETGDVKVKTEERVIQRIVEVPMFKDVEIERPSFIDKEIVIEKPKYVDVTYERPIFRNMIVEVPVFVDKIIEVEKVVILTEANSALTTVSLKLVFREEM